MLVEIWMPHDPSLDNLMLDGEIGYGLLVSGVTEEQKAKYRQQIFFTLEKEVEWLLLYTKFFCLLAHQLTYN